MTYPTDAQASAVFRPDAAIGRLAIGSSTARFVAPGSVTGGQYGLFRWDPARGSGASPHYHRTFSEAFYVLSGRIHLYDGAAWVQAGPGDFLFVPANGIHAFRGGDGPSSMLILFAPGAPRETYFEALADNIATGRTLSPEDMTAFLASHDQYMVE